MRRRWTWPEIARPAPARRRPQSTREGAPASARLRPQCRAAARTAGPLRACAPHSFQPRRLVLRIGRGAFNPDFAAFEKFVLPDRHDLFHTFDHVAARGKRIRAMRAGRGNDDAGVANRQGSNPVVDREPYRRPFRGGLAADLLERLDSQRLVRFVLEARDAAVLIVVAHDPDKGGNGAKPATARHQVDQLLQLEPT